MIFKKKYFSITIIIALLMTAILPAINIYARDVDINDLLHTIISIKNPIDLITYVEERTEKIPLKYVDELWLLKNIRTYESAYDKLRRFINFFSCMVLLIVLFPPSFLFALFHTMI